MVRKIWNASRVILLSPVALVLTILMLLVLIVTDNIPILQQLLDFIHRNDNL